MSGILSAGPLASISLHSPTGPAWEFLVLFLVVIIGPPLMQRARVPGIIGLLIGGYAIGPYGLNLIGAGNTTVPELGQLGLLYLMFVAGVELDLALVRVHRRAVIAFGLVTFALPMLFGATVGFGLGWALPASLLLGSLLASHTLLLYPAVRDAGLSADPGVATAVGATVLTDTASLIVLAGVSGSQLDGGSPQSIAFQIALGLGVLLAFTLGSCRASPGSPSATSAQTASSVTCSQSHPSSRRRPWRRHSASRGSSAPSSPGSPSTGWSPMKVR